MCSHDVPMVFLPAYQKVPNVVPQNVHNSMSDVSHMVCPKFNSHVYELKKGRTQGSTFVSILQLVLPLGGVPKCSKILMMGQSIWFLQKTNQK
jgi:hypothetical protein